MAPSQQNGLRKTAKELVKAAKGKGRGKSKKKVGDESTKPKRGKGGAVPKAAPKLSAKTKVPKLCGGSDGAGLKLPKAGRKLGCPTCRFSAKGCHICRKPTYTPRGPRKSHHP